MDIQIIDEKSTQRALDKVFSLKHGECFCVASSYLEDFAKSIPHEKSFRFSPAHESTNHLSDSCYYVVIENNEEFYL